MSLKVSQKMIIVQSKLFANFLKWKMKKHIPNDKKC